MSRKNIKSNKAYLQEIKTEFQERFDMLEESDQITPLARHLTEFVLSEISVTLALTFNENNAASFVTHLSLALTRINRGESGVEHSEIVEEAIEEFAAERLIVQRLMNECGTMLGRNIPEPEVSYIAVHLCAIVSGDAQVKV